MSAHPRACVRGSSSWRRRTAAGGHDLVDRQVRLPWVGGMFPARRASNELSAKTCLPRALVSLPEAPLRHEALEFLRFGPHLRRLIGIARVRQDFTGRAAALDALQGGAVAADPFKLPLQNANVRAAAFIAEPPTNLIMFPAVKAPHEILGFFAMDAVAMDLAAAYPCKI